VLSTGRLAAGGFAAGALMIVGSLLDWSGVEYSSGLDRGLALAAGAVAAVAAGLGLKWRRRALALAFPAGILGLNMAIVNIRDIAGHDYEYVRYPEASVGVGLYAVLVGAGLALVAGVASLLPITRRAAR
jgi:hypothetical protein